MTTSIRVVAAVRPPSARSWAAVAFTEASAEHTCHIRRGLRGRARAHTMHLPPRHRYTTCKHVLTVSSCFVLSSSHQVKGIIAEQLGVELDFVVPGASFTEDLGADSLDAVELIMAIEEAFDIEIPDEEAETMTTPADCVTAIKAKM